MTIYYYYPPLALRSSGLRTLLHHVRLLRDAGLDARILALKSFRLPDRANDLPVTTFDQVSHVDKTDVVVIPEGHPKTMALFQTLPLRRFVFALSWSYIFESLPDGVDWRSYGIERVLVKSKMVGQLVRWSMDLPVHEIDFAIDKTLYRAGPEPKERLVVYIKRKAPCAVALRRLLGARDPAFLRDIRWVALHDLEEADYAQLLRRAALFLALSTAEAAHHSVFEAMACGCLVAGFHAVGLRDIMCGDGPNANCILAENGDYPSLARALEPVLRKLVDTTSGIPAPDVPVLDAWSKQIAAGQTLAARYGEQAERASVTGFWTQILQD